MVGVAGTLGLSNRLRRTMAPPGLGQDLVGRDAEICLVGVGGPVVLWALAEAADGRISHCGSRDGGSTNLIVVCLHLPSAECQSCSNRVQIFLTSAVSG